MTGRRDAEAVDRIARILAEVRAERRIDFDTAGRPDRRRCRRCRELVRLRDLEMHALSHGGHVGLVDDGARTA